MPTEQCDRNMGVKSTEFGNSHSTSSNLLTESKLEMHFSLIKTATRILSVLRLQKGVVTI